MRGRAVEVEVLLDLALLAPSAGSLIGITMASAATGAPGASPLHTTVDISAECSVEIWSSSKCMSWQKPKTCS